MSKASEWAATQDMAPRIVFHAPDDEEIEYSVLAKVAALAAIPGTHGPRGLPILALQSSKGDTVCLRPDNALKLARWILDTFGESA